MAKAFGGFPLRCCVALAALAFNSLALNLFVGPSAGSYPSYAGFAAMLAAAVAYALLLALARRSPAVLDRPSASWIGLGSFAAGSCLIGLGYAAESTPASLAGWLLASLGTAWAAVLVGLALARLEPSKGLAPVLAAFAAVYAAASVAMPLLESVRPARLALLSLYVVTFLAALACAWKPGRAALSFFAERRAAAAGRPDEEARTLGPRAPVLFAVLFALGLVCGYTAFVVFGTRESAGVSYVAVAAAMLAVIAASRFARSRTDVVFHFGLLLVLAGLLVVPFVAQTSGGERVALVHVSNTLLAAGSECFAMLTWIVLASCGARRPAQALSLTVGGRLSVAGGVLGGLVVGVCASSLSVVNPLVPDVVAVGFAFALVAYALVGLRRFSFEDAVTGAGDGAPAPVTAVAPDAEDGREGPAAFIERNCDALACEGGLTGRETEILKMLARGRSAPFIAQELVISPNTVKTHVKHIYAKLDAHSQQEIINLVEGRRATE
ncbi:hypothetical protein C1878_12095 [Gordonibacter sp. 28C]|uniref:helix-turn-helix transcriptional regulator n=1 Tax=Gordonibacter sp. 28C TaxID=2078569 RepID=UPI000E17150B|nr:helix-turn-helix transcriptional regulator [Gordonibacter sp. 28C]RDB61223.1 hypothetical protein C1878_12095 [Gordonibacter sp. 28C]